MTGLRAGIIGIIVRLLAGLLAAFCWSLFGRLVGISAPDSAAFPVYGIGIVVFFIFGLRCGGMLANRWFPIKDQGKGITKDEEKAMKATYRKLTGRDK